MTTSVLEPQVQAVLSQASTDPFGALRFGEGVDPDMADVPVSPPSVGSMPLATPAAEPPAAEPVPAEGLPTSQGGVPQYALPKPPGEGPLPPTPFAFRKSESPPWPALDPNHPFGAGVEGFKLSKPELGAAASPSSSATLGDPTYPDHADVAIAAAPLRIVTGTPVTEPSATQTGLPPEPSDAYVPPPIEDLRHKALGKKTDEGAKPDNSSCDTGEYIPPFDMTGDAVGMPAVVDPNNTALQWLLEAEGDRNTINIPGDYVSLARAILSSTQINPAGKLVLMNLLDRAGPKAKVLQVCAYPEIRLIADDTGLSPDGARKALNVLEDDGYLRVVRTRKRRARGKKGRASNTYYFTFRLKTCPVKVERSPRSQLCSFIPTPTCLICPVCEASQPCPINELMVQYSIQSSTIATQTAQQSVVRPSSTIAAPIVRQSSTTTPSIIRQSSTELPNGEELPKGGICTEGEEGGGSAATPAPASIQQPGHSPEGNQQGDGRNPEGSRPPEGSRQPGVVNSPEEARQRDSSPQSGQAPQSEAEPVSPAKSFSVEEALSLLEASPASPAIVEPTVTKPVNPVRTTAEKIAACPTYPYRSTCPTDERTYKTAEGDIVVHVTRIGELANEEGARRAQDPGQAKYQTVGVVPTLCYRPEAFDELAFSLLSDNWAVTVSGSVGLGKTEMVKSVCDELNSRSATYRIRDDNNRWFNDKANYSHHMYVEFGEAITLLSNTTYGNKTEAYNGDARMVCDIVLANVDRDSVGRRRSGGLRGAESSHGEVGLHTAESVRGQYQESCF